MKRKLVKSLLFVALFVALFVVMSHRAWAEDCPQFRCDEGHSNWQTHTLNGPLERLYEVTVDQGGTPKQIDSATVRDDVLMIMGSVAGGDPKYAHGAAKWAAYTRFSDGAPIYTSRYEKNAPKLFFLESQRPSAGIETDSGWYQFQLNSYGAQTGGRLQESGYLAFHAGYVGLRISSDIFGPCVGRDNKRDLTCLSIRQWHGAGGINITRHEAFYNSWSKVLAAWETSPVPNKPIEEHREPLAYTIANDGIYTDNRLVTNVVASALIPDRVTLLPPPCMDGLCSWDLTTNKPVAYRAGSFGQLSSDGRFVLTHEQTEYDRFPNYMQIGGASRFVTLLDPDTLTTIWRTSVGNVPLGLQDAPLVSANSVVTVDYSAGTPAVSAFDKAFGILQWTTSITVEERRGSCPYWPLRNEQQGMLAASGDTIVVANAGITLIDARNGNILWRKPDGTYFNPIVVDGRLIVLRDESGPGVDTETGNCSALAVEVWAPGVAPTVPTEQPTVSPTSPPAATNTVAPTPTATIAPAPTCPPGCIKAPF